MKKEYISKALADTYYQAAVDGRDMRRVADQLENLRTSIEEKSLYQAWRDVDRAVGQALLQQNQELFEILQSFRKSFVDWAYEMAMAQVRQGYGENNEKGWEAFLKEYVDALVHWRYQIYSEIYKELDLEKIPEKELGLYLEISRCTPFMLEARWDQAYELFLKLADLKTNTPEQTMHFLCTAGQIQLYFFSDNAQAKSFFEQAGKAVSVEHSRVEQSLGELALMEWQLDEARNFFQKASMLDPQNEFALLFMGDSYREEARYSIAEAWYGDAQTLFPGGTDVLSRYIRLFEKRDYFKEKKPERIGELIELITKLSPIERYSALLDGGFAFQSNDRFDEAEQLFREATVLNPDRGSGWINLGYILEKKNLPEAAEEAFNKALEIDPDYFDAHWGLVYLYERTEGKEEEALKSLETCLRLRPTWEVFILPRISDLQRKLGKEELANDLLLNCLKKYPDKDAEPLRLLHEQVNALAEGKDGEEKAIQLLDLILKAKGEGYSDNYTNRYGNVKFQYQKFEEAAAQYKKAISINPKVPIYYYNLGLAMDRLDRLDEAEAAYKQYLDLDTSSPDNLNTIGVFYYKKRQQYPKAAELYRKAIEGNPQNDNFHYNLALVLEKLEQWGDAESAYLKAVECDPQDPENYNGLGVFYYGRQLYEQAVSNYQKAIAINPDEALYHANLGLAYQLMDMRSEELSEYLRAAGLNSRYFLEVGRIYYNRENYPEAIAAFEKAGNAIEQFPVNLAYLGLSYENLGQADVAEQIFLKALGKDPSLDDYFYNRLGILNYRRERHKEAVGYYSKAIELVQLGVYYENLGLAHEGLGEHFLAISAYEKAMQTEPENGQFPNRLGVFHYSAGRHKDAIPMYKKALELDPENAVYQNNLALALEGDGQIDEAEKAYRRAIELDPENATYPNYLGGMYYRAGRFQDAAPCFEKAVSLDPKVGFYFENLGLSFENQGMIKEAEEAYRKAIAIEPDSPVYQNRLGLFFFNQGRYRDSIPHYENALEKDPENTIYLANLGLAHLNLQEGSLAAKFFKKALEVQPEDPQLEEYLRMAEQIKTE